MENKAIIIGAVALAGLGAYLLLNKDSGNVGTSGLSGGGGASGDEPTPEGNTYVTNNTTNNYDNRKSSSSSQQDSPVNKIIVPDRSNLNPITYSQQEAKMLETMNVQNGSFYNASTGGYINYTNGLGSSSAYPTNSPSTASTQNNLINAMLGNNVYKDVGNYIAGQNQMTSNKATNVTPSAKITTPAVSSIKISAQPTVTKTATQTTTQNILNMGKTTTTPTPKMSTMSTPTPTAKVSTPVKISNSISSIKSSVSSVMNRIRKK